MYCRRGLDGRWGKLRCCGGGIDEEGAVDLVVDVTG